MLSSKVADYLLRPEILENVSLYDFLCDYNVTRPHQNSFEWIGDHINRGRLKVCAMKQERVPWSRRQ